MEPSTEYDYIPPASGEMRGGIAPMPDMPSPLNAEEEELELVGGQELAGEEEQQLLDSVMDTIEALVNGQLKAKVDDTLNASPDLWQSVSQLSNGIVQRMAFQLDEQGIENDGGIFFGENGVIQQTVEMLWDEAAKIDHPSVEDEEQFNAAYFATIKLVGESLEQDEDSAREAQDYILEVELGEDVVGRAAEQLQAKVLGAPTDTTAPVKNDPMQPSPNDPSSVMPGFYQ